MSKKTISTYYCDLCGKNYAVKNFHQMLKDVPMIVLELTIMATTFIL